MSEKIFREVTIRNRQETEAKNSTANAVFRALYGGVLYDRDRMMETSISQSELSVQKSH